MYRQGKLEEQELGVKKWKDSEQRIADNGQYLTFTVHPSKSGCSSVTSVYSVVKKIKATTEPLNVLNSLNKFYLCCLNSVFRYFRVSVVKFIQWSIGIISVFPWLTSQKVKCVPGSISLSITRYILRILLLATFYSVLVTPVNGQVQTPGNMEQRINYQGNYLENSVPVNGTRRFWFKVYNTDSGGSPVWEGGGDLSVTNGMFSYVLDFSTGTGTNRAVPDLRGNAKMYIEVEAGTGAGSMSVLTPRERLNYAMYSMYTSSAAYSYDAGTLAGNVASQFIDVTGSTQTKSGGLNLGGNIVSGGLLEFTNNTGYRIRTDTAGGDLQVQDRGDGSADLHIQRNTGNVGIGTINPGARVDIQETDNTKLFSLRIGTSTTDGGYHLVVSTSGNIGIGTTNPWMGKLQIEDNSYTTGEHFMLFARDINKTVATVLGYRADGTNATRAIVRAGGNKPIDFGTTSNPQSMSLLDSGNLGIGTTNPTQKLDVVGNIAVSGTVDGVDISTVSFGGGSLFTDGGAVTYLTATGDSLAVGGTVGNNSKLYFDVGTSSLSVNGNIRTTGNINVGGSSYVGFGNTVGDTGYGFKDNAGTIQWKNNGGSWANIGSGSGNNITSGDSNVTVTDSGDGYITFTEDNIEFLRLTNGTVGIGTTSPFTKFHVSRADSNWATKIENTAGAVLFGGVNNKGRVQGITPANAVADLILNDTGGNVGIGTTGPAGKLHIINGSVIIGGNLGSGAAVQVDGDIHLGGANRNIFNYGNNSLSFGTNNSAQMTIASTNNVGIGTIEPVTKLDVFGGSITVRGSNAGLTVGTFTVTIDGNVGIGTISPAQKLDVVGNIAVSGTVDGVDISTVAFGGGSSKWIDGGAVTYLTATGDSLAIGGTAGNTAKLYFDVGTSSLSVNGPVRIGAYNLPSTDGSNGYVLKTNGAGAVTWQTDSTGAGGNSISQLDSNVTVTDAGDGYISLIEDNTEYVRLTGGKIGVGTMTPGARLEISTNSAETTYPWDTGDLRINNQNTNTGVFSGLSFLHGGSINGAISLKKGTGNDSALTFWTNTGTGVSEKVRIDKIGNIGIGTTSPGNKIHIYSNLSADGLSIDGTNNPGLVFRNNGSITSFIGVATASGSWSTDAAANDLILRTEWNKILFNVNAGSSSAMTINNGNVGIGTIVPGAKLHIDSVGTGNEGLGYFFNNLDAANEYSFIAIGKDNSVNNAAAYGFINGSAVGEEGAAIWVWGDNPGQGLFVKKSGNVGIGTTNPRSRLDIASSSSEGNIFGIDQLVGYNDIRFYTDNTGTLERMRITSGGSVGIGTASPLSSLHVAGASIESTPTQAGVHLGIGSNYAAIELAGTSGSYIDFNNGLNNDYDARFILTGDDRLDLQGSNLVIKDGTVGIGMNEQPTTKLDIYGGSITVRGVNVGLTVGTFTVTIDGNVGIGTTNPSAKMQVQDGDIRISTTTGGTKGIYFTDGSYQTSAGVGSASSISNANNAIITADADANGTGNVILRSGSTDSVFISTNGYIGVGTTIPTKQLHLLGNGIFIQPDSFWSSGDQANIYLGDTLSYLQNTYASGLKIYANDNLYFDRIGTGAKNIYFQVGGSTQIVIDANGNVGIGVMNPGQALSIYRTANDAKLGIGTLTSGNPSIELYGYQSGNDWQFISDESDSSKLKINQWTGAIWNNVLTIQQNGNVGIGTTSPTVKLEVGGTIVTGPYGKIVFGSNGLGGGWGEWIDNDSTDLKFATANNVRMTINSSGNVGIGTTNPVAKLDLGRLPADTEGLRIQIGSTTPWSPLVIYKEDGTDAFRVKQDGNVGIGTTSPIKKLHIIGSMFDAALQLQNINATTQWNLGVGETSAPNWGANNFVIDQEGTGPRLTINSSGNVGIGTTSPITKFVVNNGSITVTGTNANLRVDGSIYPGNQTTRYMYDYNVTGNYATRFSSAVIIDGSLNVNGNINVHQTLFQVGTSTISLPQNIEIEVINSSITTNGGWVMLVYSPYEIKTAQSSLYLRLYRNTTLLKEFRLTPDPNSATGYFSQSFTHIDAPPQGINNYSVKVLATGNTNFDYAGLITGQQRDLILVEMKK